MAVAATARRVQANNSAKEYSSVLVQGVEVIDKMSYQKMPQSPLASPISLEHSSRPEPDGGLKKRKALKGKIPAEIKRSASTPHIRGLALSDSSGLSPTQQSSADKRRNKLGYHRTSVACGTLR